MDDKQYFKTVGQSIELNTYKCEIYVPQSYFDAKLAVQDGILYELFFIVKYKLFHTETADPNKLPFGDFMFPSIITTQPDEVSSVELDLFGIKEKFQVFTYYKGSSIVHNCSVVKTSIMVERYVSLLNDGKIRVPYNRINDVTNMVQKVHDVKLNIPQYIQQLTISEVYRAKEDYSKPARLVVSIKDKDNSKVKPLNMRENSAFTSTLAGVSFEDIKSMLVVADNRDDAKSTNMSPIEKVIRGVRDKPKEETGI